MSEPDIRKDNPLSGSRQREELPLKALRRRLTMSFVWVSLLIYLIAGSLSVVIFSSSLKASMSANLNRLLADIQPSIDIDQHRLSLKAWAQNAAEQGIHIVHVVQLFDSDGKLQEAYGVSGVTQLRDGDCSVKGLHNLHRFCSKYVSVHGDGYLQIQLDTRQTDEAFVHFLITMIELVPVVALTAGATGYLYCGYAVSPVANSFKVLRQFIDDAGHELRTPVAVITASVQTLEDALTQDPSVSDLIEKVHRASHRLKHLSNNLITLASMESPESQLEKYILDANTLVMQVCDDFQDLSAEKAIDLQCRCENPSTTACSVFGNGDALQRMLSNLIENAIRYTPSGGNVTVSSAVQAQQVVITVQDNGIGIPPESLPHVFDRFYRVDKARTREQGGTGLGLSIVKAIVEAHSGSISVTSTAGAGTRFKVQLPLSSETATTAALKDKVH